MWQKLRAVNTFWRHCVCVCKRVHMWKLLLLAAIWWNGNLPDLVCVVGCYLHFQGMERSPPRTQSIHLRFGKRSRFTEQAVHFCSQSFGPRALFRIVTEPRTASNCSSFVVIFTGMFCLNLTEVLLYYSSCSNYHWWCNFDALQLPSSFDLIFEVLVFGRVHACARVHVRFIVFILFRCRPQKMHWMWKLHQGKSLLMFLFISSFHLPFIMRVQI